MQLTTTLTFLLSTLSLTAAYIPILPPASTNQHHSLLMLTRQTIPSSCAIYSQTANYTFIGANATIRAAFLQASPAGTDPTANILDSAAQNFKNANMMFDANLNAECGNLSTLASEEVNANFSMGIVGPFKIVTKKNGQADLVQTNGGARMVRDVGVVGVSIFVSGLLL